MISEIKFDYPTWYILLCVLLGIGYAVALYYRDKRWEDMPGWSRWVLGILRALTATALATLLLSPLLKSISEEVKQPIVVVAEDVSQSMESADRQDLDKITQELSQSYEVSRLSIGDEITAGRADSLTANVTNLSNALSYIDENYADQNLGAVILSTDGIYNEGKNPIYTTTNITAPVYILAQGDTTQRRDLLIKNVFANKIAYLGDKFAIQVDVSGVNASGSSNLTVQHITDGGRKRVHSENIRIDKSSFFTTKEIIIDANTVGVNRYRIGLSPIRDEVSTQNNYKDIYIEVLDARQKILLLANAPHPDLGAYRQIIDKNKNYESDIAFITDPNVNTAEYDIVVLHNLPSQKHDMNAVYQQLKRRNTPHLFVVGAQTDLNGLNGLQEVIKVKGDNRNSEYVQPTLVDNFNSFTIGDELRRVVETFPPLTAPFGEYTDPLGANILLKQKIKDIDTQYPLLAFRDSGGSKTGVFVGEGLWKWRLFNYVQADNYDAIEELVNKMLQYIGTKADKRKFRANTSKNLYKINEEILFDAQLFNDNYEMINDPDVFLTIENADGKEYKFTFPRTSNYYSLNARQLPVGKYSYEASTSFNGEPFAQKGYFSVQDIQLESYDLTARHGMLKSLAEQYGGATFLPGSSQQILDSLNASQALKPVVYPTTQTKSVINLKWLFWMLLALLSLEWFLRRYWGSY